MNKSLIRLFAGVAVALALPITIQAQNNPYAGASAGNTTPRYSGTSVRNLGTWLPLAGSTASNTTATVDTRFQKDVALEITMWPKTTDTAAISFYFIPTVSGLYYATNKGVTITLAPSGTAGLANTVVTNLPSQGAGGYQLSYITNASATAGDTITNILIYPGGKFSAP